MRDDPKLATQILAGTFVLIVLAAAYKSGERYESLMQEDRFLEWLTAVLFAIAGVVRLRTAIINRRWFDGLVGLFCLFVAGEEFSWGQRLLGYTPPDWFLAHNVQQEATLHNFADVFGRPKWSLISVLFGYGLLLPLLDRFASTRNVLAKIRATPPPDSLAPWFALAVILLIWYPLSYTGEWVELLAGLLFLGAATTTTVFIASVIIGVVASIALASISARRSGGRVSLDCARSEVVSLLTDLAEGGAQARLFSSRSVDRRMWSTIEEGKLDPARLPRFHATRCDVSVSVSRRQFLVDPWGSSYRVLVRRRPDGLADLGVYSVGPNRRRDARNDPNSDDVVAVRVFDPTRIIPPT